MTNPARRLHDILTAWFNESGNTQEVIRQLSASGESPEVTRLHLDAMACLLEIDHRLTAFEAEGRNVATYRRMVPTWIHAVLMYPGGWQVRATLSDHAGDALVHLADLIDLTVPSVRAERVEDVTALLDRVTSLLGEDGSLTDELRRYMVRLVQETRTALMEHETLGTFDLNEAMMRLWVAMNAAAEQSKGKKREWRGVVRDLLVGTASGMIANSPTFIISAIGG